MNDASALPQAASIFDNWNETVRAIIRRARGLQDDAVVDLPNGVEGTYIRYALDKNGNLSMGKTRGRLRLRHAKRDMNALAKISSQLFTERLSRIFAKIAAATPTDENGKKEMPPLTQEQFRDAMTYAEKRAPHVLAEQQLNPGRKAARERQQASRRINAGLVQTQRAAHSAA